MIDKQQVAAVPRNCMAVASMLHAPREAHWANPALVHASEHCDRDMSDAIPSNRGVTLGTNRLVEPDSLAEYLRGVQHGTRPAGQHASFCDYRSARRAVESRCRHTRIWR